MVKSDMRRMAQTHFECSNIKPLSVLLLTWEFPPHIVGGLARHTEGLSHYLQKNGVNVHVITTKPSSTGHCLEEVEEVEGVQVHRVEPLNTMDNQFINWIGGLNLSMIKKALELAETYHFKMIHAHDWLVGEAAQTLTRILKIPLITTIHATEYGRNSGIYSELQQFIHQKESKLIQASNQILVCSEFMKDEVSDIFNVSTEKINIIPNGVRIDEVLDKSLNNIHPLLLNEKRKIIFSIGRLVKEKGFDLIIEAAAKMDRKEICFVIAGTGPMYEKYESLIKKYNLENDVFLTGFITDQQRNHYFEKCSMAIFPSRYEPFGIVALEALKFKKPVIVSETGGLKGIIKPFETGLFMKPGDVSSLVNQINFILNSPNDAEKLASNGNKLVENFYSWQRVAEMTKRQYEDLLLLTSIEPEGTEHKIKFELGENNENNNGKSRASLR